MERQQEVGTDLTLSLAFDYGVLGKGLYLSQPPFLDCTNNICLEEIFRGISKTSIRFSFYIFFTHSGSK